MNKDEYIEYLESQVFSLLSLCRLMKKYNLLVKVRRRNPYRDMITGEIPSFVLSNNLGLGATLESIDILERKYLSKQCKGMVV